MSSKTTLADFLEAKRQGRKFTAVSCYDYTTARLIGQCNVEMILVGDSAAQVILGHDSTLPATMDFMVTITAAVARAGQGPLLVADMPFLSYQLSIAEAIKNASRFIVEAGAKMVKIEATAAQIDTIKAICDADIAVMAHLGMRPQARKLKAQASTAETAIELVNLADRMVDAGASFVLLEGVAMEVAKIITQRLPVPVLSCGSGLYCDGQILIINDILGLTAGPMPKFAKSYGNLGPEIVKAVKAYAEEISAGKYPDDNHSYHIKAGQLEELEKMLRLT